MFSKVHTLSYPFSFWNISEAILKLPRLDFCAQFSIFLACFHKLVPSHSMLPVVLALLDPYYVYVFLNSLHFFITIWIGKFHGSGIMEELQGQNAILRDCMENLMTVESSRANLVSHLREALQEQVGKQALSYLQNYVFSISFSFAIYIFFFLYLLWWKTVMVLWSGIQTGSNPQSTSGSSWLLVCF